jgi:hypothetical protein
MVFIIARVEKVFFNVRVLAGLMYGIVFGVFLYNALAVPEKASVVHYTGGLYCPAVINAEIKPPRRSGVLGFAE